MGVLDLDQVPFLTLEELKKKVESSCTDQPDVVRMIEGFLNDHSLDVQSRSMGTKQWLNWCSEQKKRIKVVNGDVPGGILPKKCNGCLYDIKVAGGFKNGSGPDDKMYNQYSDLREKVARGNTVMYFHDTDDNTVYFDNVIFALRKFTGGMGDEDEDQPENNQTWMNYFLKPAIETTAIVCTRKANGEAAHLSVRWIKDRWILCAGSKNVHMLVRTDSDVEKYTDSRFMVAKTVSTSVLGLLGDLTMDNATVLLNFMHHTQLTAVFEVLQPHYQHVVDLSYLDASELHFITWTSPFGIRNDLSYCALAPNMALDFASRLGLKTIEYDVIDGAQAEERMSQVRRGYGYEGEVLYFMDKHKHVIGLLKKKTAWYVILRAVREKVCAAYADYRKNPAGYSNAGRDKKMKLRLVQIKDWLGVPQTAMDKYEALSLGFLHWVIVQGKANSLPNDQVRGNFPSLWNRYLSEGGKSDRISWEVDVSATATGDNCDDKVE